MTSIFEDQRLLEIVVVLQWLLSNNVYFRNITINNEIVLSLPRLSQFINVMSLRKVSSVIVIADLLLTWQHLTTMNIAIAK